MTRLDERLRRELERAGRPADPSGVYEEVIRRRERRRIVRRLQAGALALAVSAGSFAGIWALTRGPSGGTIATPGPEGTIAAVLSGYPGPGGTGRTTQALAFISTADGSVRRALPDPSGILGPVSWSPDGERLAFWLVPETNGGAADPAGIYTMDIAGGEPSLLFETDLSIWAMAWSPDGQRIAFVGAQPVRATELDQPIDRSELDRWTTIFTIAADGSDLREIPMRGIAQDLAWSPDGSSLAVTEVSREGELGFAEDIYLLDLATGRETRLTDDGRSRNPAWSPDGSRIAFVSGSPRFDRLFVVNTDGTGLRRLTNPDGTDASPTWSPDGEWIAVTRRVPTLAGASGALGPSGVVGASGPLGGETCQVVLVRADGSEERVLADGPIYGACPIHLTWRPAPAGAGTAETIEPSREVSGPTDSTVSPALVPGVGLGCNVSTVSGDFLGQGSEGIAYVYAEPSDAAGCPPPGEPSYHAVVVADDAASTPLELLDCIGGCAAYAAPDIDADGTSELAISIAGADGISVTLFDVVERGGRVEVEQMEIVPPGEPGTLLEPGPIRFAVGGTVGWTAGAYCLSPTTGHDATGARLVVWFAQMRDGDPDLWTVTIGSLIVDGSRLHAAGVGTYAVPEQEPALPPATPGELCGAPVT